MVLCPPHGHWTGQAINRHVTPPAKMSFEEAIEEAEYDSHPLASLGIGLPLSEVYFDLPV